MNEGDKEQLKTKRQRISEMRFKEKKQRRTLSREAYTKILIGRRQFEKRIKKLQESSLTDPLTGLYNRRWLLGDESEEKQKSGELKKILDQINRKIRDKKEPLHLTILAIDIDKFKEINDTLGHKVGDLVLQKLANLLKNTLRTSDEIARIGGDEFIIVFSDPEELDENKLNSFIERLRKTIREDKSFSGDVNPTISIGCTRYPNSQEIEDPRILLGQADGALYESKRLGGNISTIYHGVSPDGSLTFSKTIQHPEGK